MSRGRPHSWLHGTEKIGEAVCYICESNEKRARKLANAHLDYLADLREEHVPGGIWAEIGELRAALGAGDDEENGEAGANPLAAAERLPPSEQALHLRRVGEWLWALASDDLEDDL